MQRLARFATGLLNGMTRKNRAITLSLDSAQKQRLEQLATSFGLTWGDEPNVSALIREIADGRLAVSRADAPIPEASRPNYEKQLQAIKGAVSAMENLIG